MSQITVRQEALIQLRQARRYVTELQEILLDETKWLADIFRMEKEGLGAHRPYIEALIDELAEKKYAFSGPGCMWEDEIMYLENLMCGLEL